MFNNFFFSENRAAYGKYGKNFVQPSKPQMTTWRMRLPYWILKATNTLSEYIIILNLPLQQWLHEHASMLRYTALPALLNIRHKYTCT
jgi:hypothetical protein